MNGAPDLNEACWGHDSGLSSPARYEPVQRDISRMSFNESHEYLKQLLHESEFMKRNQLNHTIGNAYKFLDAELNRVRHILFTMNTGQIGPLELPEPTGPIVQLNEKLYVPQKEHPDFNFVGRILGPRGMTAKQLEQATGCKIMVRGRGSMRDRKKYLLTKEEEQNRGKPNWEHLNEELHVLITCEDTEERAKIKLKRAVDEISRLLVPAVDGEDELKKNQLMELAILNGTYRDQKAPQLAFPGLIQGPRIIPVGLPQAAHTIRPAMQTTSPPAQQILLPQAANGLQPANPIRSVATTTPVSSMATAVPINHQQLLEQQQLQAMAASQFVLPDNMVPMISAGLGMPAPLIEYAGMDAQTVAAAAVAGAVKPVHAAQAVRTHPYQRL